MFYEDLYTVLGKLFYQIAHADNNVQPAEKKKLQELVISKWEPLESSNDNFGTDKAEIISFAFDFEESESFSDNGFEEFESFYKLYKENFTAKINNNILETVEAVSNAYRGKNKAEDELINKLKQLLKN